MDFAARYRKLNTAQKQAVDTIDGPVMVIAGPGTGKTELLSMRSANILAKTDTLPENILCLTFTDSGAHAMRERLAAIIGKDAYKVAIHTFHGFGSEIINQYGQFFYHGAEFRPADELSSYEIIRGILDELEYSNPLAGKMNGEYTHLSDTLQTISELKRSGLTSDELLQVLDSNDSVLDKVEAQLQEVFAKRIGATTLAQLVPIAHTIAEIQPPDISGGATPLSKVLSLSLAHAIDEATKSNSTKPITAWKNRWFTKDDTNQLVFKARAQHNKLRAVSFVYFQYLARMQEAELYDYDDMILRVVHALEVFDELRYNLHEKYHYIMVDEFQDTNLAQMRILHNLTNNPAHDDTPNILVVGDDDQAIYSFQGADISNILSFRDNYPKATLIPLTDNYRSSPAILEQARAIITQGEDRLEHHLTDLDKTLTPHVHTPSRVELYEAPTVNDERAWIVEQIAVQISDGVTPSDISVLARRHHELEGLLPYFAAAGIAVNYERRDNILDLEPIRCIEQIAQLVVALASQDLKRADSLLPPLLAHPALGFEPLALWRLSVSAYDNRKRWFDTMAATPDFQAIHAWLVDLSINATQQPLEQLLDRIMGSHSQLVTESEQDDELVDPTSDTKPLPVFVSPLYDYYFGEEALAKRPGQYLAYLEGLRTLRHKLREYHNDLAPTLSTFLEFISLHRQMNTPITSVQAAQRESPDAINLMTAHKSKGLEFDTVFITGAVDSMWGERVRSRHALINYPENLPLRSAGDSADERLRLFFVAATRAKRQLVMSYSLSNDAGKSYERAGFLLEMKSKPIELINNKDQAIHTAEIQWYERIAQPTANLSQLLAPTLEQYKLSATHLGNFLDVTRGGPQTFLLNNLLRFPQSMSPAAAYGSAIHATLQRAHAHLAATKKQRALEDILHDFETSLADHRLSEDEQEALLQKGTDTLQAFLTATYHTFTPDQKSELSFGSQQSLIDEQPRRPLRPGMPAPGDDEGYLRHRVLSHAEYWGEARFQ